MAQTTDNTLSGPGLEAIEKDISVAHQVESAGLEKAAALQIQGDVLLVAGTNEVRRIPIPTDNPNDPLNWSKWRKLGVTITCCWFAVFSLLSISGISTFFNTLFQMYMPAQTSDQIVGLSTYPTMVMALGSFGLLPLALVFGRRPVFLFAVLLAFVTIIIAGTSDTFNAHFISRIFLGLATGSTESLLPLILTDVTFLDERSFYFGLYWFTQNAINAGLQIGLSYLTAAASWRWYYWLFAITLGLGIIMGVFFLPESKFHRTAAAIGGYVVVTDDFGHTHFLTDEEARARFGGKIFMPTADGESKQPKTFLQALLPWGRPAPNPLRVWIMAYVKIFQSLSSPGVIFALLSSSITLGIAVAMSLVYSTILEESFGWSPASVGLFNVGIIPASIVAMFYSGWFASKVNLWLAKRNGGVHKPEHHLIHLILPFISGVIGIVLFGVVANDPELHSGMQLAAAWGIYEFGFTAVLITTTTFASEVIPDNPGAAMVPVVGGKNIVSFGASYGLIPMLAEWSYIKSFLILLAIYCSIFALGIPVYFFNPMWRKAALKRASESI